MVYASISELTTYRWELADEIELIARHGFDSISLWRTKLSDVGVAAAAALLDQAGLRVASVQWAGGFTGGDGRSFAESVDDALEAVDAAGRLGADVLVVHSGCRGGHTGSHARRLLADALDVLAPEALARGVTLAVKPMHRSAAAGGSFLTTPVEAAAWVERFDHPAVRMVLDLWHFGHDRGLVPLLDRLVPSTALVQVADRRGPPQADAERLPPGQGDLPLSALIASLVERGYAGAVEFSAVGEAVESLGCEEVLRQASATAAAWGRLVRVPA
ncbi:MAG: sugar phosphate isomerase/epimerase [Planctomycetia bacterium]|nr:sugar phosphate isomerase/epimerase [Planctomycetia bacterium]